MKVSVYGLGYVGAVTAGILAEQGNAVIGIDTNPAKVRLIQQGSSPVIEPRLGEIIAENVDRGTLRATTNPLDANDWKVAFVCVGTPSGAGGQLDPSALRTVLMQIGKQIRDRTDFPVIAIRSTIAPHLIDEVVLPSLVESSGLAPGTGYGLVVMPEFLREGTSVQDFYSPPFTLIGETDPNAGDIAQELFTFIDAPTIRLRMGEAMMVKYASNAFHALKVSFANEIGLLCAYDGLDSHQVMAAFCRDPKLNISRSYLLPGFAFGGSCLPKDLRALNHRARRADIDTPLMTSILASNRSYLQRCTDIVLATQRTRIGIFGMSFKPDTDDLRESPMLSLIESLIGKGKKVAVYDSKVHLARLTGANRQYIDKTIPHIASLMRSTLDSVIAHAEVLVVGSGFSESDQVRSRIREDQLLIDFSEPLSQESLASSLTGPELAAVNA